MSNESVFRWNIEEDVLDRFINKIAKSGDPVYDLQILACKAIDAIACTKEAETRSKVRHLRVVSDKAIGAERELFHTA